MVFPPSYALDNRPLLMQEKRFLNKAFKYQNYLIFIIPIHLGIQSGKLLYKKRSPNQDKVEI